MRALLESIILPTLPRGGHAHTPAAQQNCEATPDAAVVAELRGGELSIRRGVRDGLRDRKAGQAPRRSACRRPDADAKSTQKIPASDRLSHVLLLSVAFVDNSVRRGEYTPPGATAGYSRQRPFANPAT